MLSRMWPQQETKVDLDAPTAVGCGHLNRKLFVKGKSEQAPMTLTPYGGQLNGTKETRRQPIHPAPKARIASLTGK